MKVCNVVRWKNDHINDKKIKLVINFGQGTVCFPLQYSVERNMNIHCIVYITSAHKIMI